MVTAADKKAAVKTFCLIKWQRWNLWTMEAFIAVTNKDEYEQERFIINDILEDLERSRRLTKTA